MAKKYLHNFASWLRTAARGESHTYKHNWPPVNSLFDGFEGPDCAANQPVIFCKAKAKFTSGWLHN